MKLATIALAIALAIGGTAAVIAGTTNNVMCTLPNGTVRPTTAMWAVVQQVTYDPDDDDTCYVMHTTVTYGPYISDESGAPGTFRVYADGAPTRAVGDHVEWFVTMP